ncbi:MAG TPA: hypothetical protein VG389_25565 [Myxococcota bacterium]|jgi:hypothetical protein|nr:hypothetical protein [Myxococcota bacterium]
MTPDRPSLASPTPRAAGLAGRPRATACAAALAGPRPRRARAAAFAALLAAGAATAAAPPVAAGCARYDGVSAGTIGGVAAAGKSAPDFTLTGADGRAYHLADARALGPVVLIFNRGYW